MIETAETIRDRIATAFPPESGVVTIPIRASGKSVMVGAPALVIVTGNKDGGKQFTVYIQET